MSRDFIRFRSNPERERLFSQAKEALGVDADYADSKTVDLALEHLVESKKNLQKWEELQLSPEQAKGVSTSVISLTYYPQVRT